MGVRNARGSVPPGSRLAAWRPGLATVAASLLALLVLLATLQYLWLGQLSAAELSRLRASARAAATAFALHFDREITRAFLWLRFDPVTVPERDGERFARRYDRWLREAPHPGLVRGVFLLEPASAALQFDPVQRAFTPAPWPPGLEVLQEPGGRFFDPVIEDPPALVIPLLPRELPPLSAAIERNGEVPVRYGVVLLDSEYLKREFIPALARQHLSSGGALDYSLEIVARNDSTAAFYRSAPERPVQTSGSGDASVDLFTVSLDGANRDLMLDEVFSFHVMDTRRAMRRETVRIAGIAGPPPGPRTGRWRLVLTHPGGSLERVVAGIRRRNTALAFGIVLVLGLSVVMIAVATRRAQRLARAQMEFVAGVSHELGTPLSVICTAGENLADGLLGGGEPVHRYGALIRDEGRRLREIVDQVLEFSAPGGPAIRREPLDLRAVIDGALAACREEIVEGGFEVHIDVAPSLPPVAGDAAALGRALQNLIRNALKYSGTSRWLAVRIESTRTGRSEQVSLTVRDGGLGIEPGEMSRIFEPFFRGREALSRQIHGTGLGLSLVHRIAQQHNGSITVVSEAGRGSSFTIRLPASAVDATVVRHASGGSA
jgi:signal transduction histidine kinase